MWCIITIQNIVKNIYVQNYLFIFMCRIIYKYSHAELFIILQNYKYLCAELFEIKLLKIFRLLNIQLKASSFS